jgi:hypothetical protein
MLQHWGENRGRRAIADLLIERLLVAIAIPLVVAQIP